MKNVQRPIFFFELLNQWNFHTYKDLFNMTPNKRYEKMFQEVLGGFTHPDSRYEMLLTISGNEHAIGFAMEDREINELVLFAGLQEYGNKGVMWPDWMYIPMAANNLYIDDKHESTNKMLAEPMSEEEHFQTMMLRDLPPFEYYAKGIKVYEYLAPIANKHSIGFSVDYKHMDMDFNEFIPSENAFTKIDSLFGNALALFYEAENHGNPVKYYNVS